MIDWIMRICQPWEKEGLQMKRVAVTAPG